LRIGRHSTPVGEIRYGADGVPDHVMRPSTRNVGDEPDAARVMFKAWIIQGISACIMHGRTRTG
jgi:hypothetical protein